MGLTSFFLVSAFSDDQIIPAKILGKIGVSVDEITCKPGYELVIKKSDDSPACVTGDTAQKLVESGWAKEFAPQTNPKTYSDTWNSQNSRDTDVSASPQASSGSGSGGFMGSSSGSYTLEESLGLSQRMGFSVGGAKDIDNFRENIKNEFLPLYSDVTYEGLFYDYYFDTGEQKECKKQFCPSYSYALSEDPFSKTDEYYLSVGLNSGLTEKDFERKKLNLVVVLDVSGSMSSPFDHYYYDKPHGIPIYDTLSREEQEDLTKSKMHLASKSIVSLLGHLNEDDNLGVVLFNNDAHVSKPLESIEYTNLEKLKENILSIQSGGGTHLNSGMIAGTALFDGIEIDANYENRIIFLTDAIPNILDTTPEGLLDKLTKNAESKIYTTFIGIGVDFNSELVEAITKVKGANYYSVHSSVDFKQRMDDEFELMVTPLVFDLVLSLESVEFSIKEVYGSPDADQSTGEIMKVSTLFPSKTQKGETRGGIVLIKLEKSQDYGTITLQTSYEDRNGVQGGDSAVVILNEDHTEDYYENSGIHKGVLLSRYANLMKTWAYDERKSHNDIFDFGIKPDYYEDGMYLPDYVGNGLGEWERQSIPLKVSGKYNEMISEFMKYYDSQSTLLDDSELDQERKIMEKLVNLRV